MGVACTLDAMTVHETDGCLIIVTAAMGGGHDGAAREIARRATLAGHRVVVHDLLAGMRWGYGRFITGFYRTQVRHAMWSYEAIYEHWRTRPELVGTANAVNTRMARKDLVTLIDDEQPCAVVTTYNLGAQVLGELTRHGDIDVPVFAFVTDFGFHPYWAHPDISGYFTVHPSTAAALGTFTDAPVVVTGPFVAPAFRPDRAARLAVRADLGIADDEPMALVVAGAWGVGSVEATVADLDRLGTCTPVVVTGHNPRLARRLTARIDNPGHVLGFVDTMPRLMAAADVLVENAGGLTAMEAFASSLPVVTYRPIPAHGTDNARVMADAGVTRWAADVAALERTVRNLTSDPLRRQRQIDVARSIFHADAIDRLTRALALGDDIEPGPEPREQDSA